jgi:hypothetical protein
VTCAGEGDEVEMPAHVDDLGVELEVGGFGPSLSPSTSARASPMASPLAAPVAPSFVSPMHGLNLHNDGDSEDLDGSDSTSSFPLTTSSFDHSHLIAPPPITFPRSSSVKAPVDEIDEETDGVLLPVVDELSPNTTSAPEQGRSFDANSRYVSLNSSSMRDDITVDFDTLRPPPEIDEYSSFPLNLPHLASAQSGDSVKHLLSSDERPTITGGFFDAPDDSELEASQGLV